MRVVALIGMPGSGKSTVGRALAKISGMDFIDLDEFIEIREGLSPSKIIKDHGEPIFRDAESAALKAALESDNIVIATGGGAVLREENRELLRAKAWTVYIERDIACLATKGRPLSTDLCALYEKRHPIYSSCANMRITNDQTPSCVAKKIWQYRKNCGIIIRRG